MVKSLPRTDKDIEQEIAEIYERHMKTVYRVSYAYMKCAADTEDIVQEAFYRLIKTGTPFESEEHEKAWLIRTATNLCKNALGSKWRRRENIDDHEDLRADENVKQDDVFAAVTGLPEKYKTVVYLYYYEGYDSVEIADILRKPKSTIRNYLHEARGILREKLGGYTYEE